MRETLAKVGATTNPGSPQDFGRFIAAETAKWGRCGQDRRDRAEIPQSCRRPA